jgi:glycosyltransferase involved in cell wall biosynthesis
MITPVVLSYNEEPNIGLTLASLEWLPRVVVLDSGSTDRTKEIAASFRNVSWFQRPFDNHLMQWSYGIHATAITTDYVLALDSDMRPSDGFQRELNAFLKEGDHAGGAVPFEYRVLGKNLSNSIYPRQIRVFRRDKLRIEQPGHTQVFTVDGPVYQFRCRLIHEDRKSVDRWLRNQAGYAELEARRIRSQERFGLKDRLRLAGIGPVLWGGYAYIRAGGPLRSPASEAYAYERMIFEAILARKLTEVTKGDTRD